MVNGKNLYFVFDIDGTIAPPRKPLEEDFAIKFKQLCTEQKVVLVTGSDRELALEQIPKDILPLVKLYTCSGVEGLDNIKVDYEIYEKASLVEALEKILKASSYPHRTGNHISVRKGMINFSVVGRNASPEDRISYNEYDKKYREREYIVRSLKNLFWNYDICIGGEISIDITKRGINKSLVAKDLFTKDPNAYIIFFGNQILDGNDYFLAKYLQENNLGHSIQIDYENLKDIL